MNCVFTASPINVTPLRLACLGPTDGCKPLTLPSVIRTPLRAFLNKSTWPSTLPSKKTVSGAQIVSIGFLAMSVIEQTPIVDICAGASLL